MPRITVRRHGASASIPHVGVHNGTLQSDPTRTANRGWTPPSPGGMRNSSSGWISV